MLRHRRARPGPRGRTAASRPPRARARRTRCARARRGSRSAPSAGTARAQRTLRPPTPVEPCPQDHRATHSPAPRAPPAVRARPADPKARVAPHRRTISGAGLEWGTGGLAVLLRRLRMGGGRAGRGLQPCAHGLHLAQRGHTSSRRDGVAFRLPELITITRCAVRRGDSSAPTQSLRVYSIDIKQFCATASFLSHAM
jgi:hypothetical protein